MKALVTGGCGFIGSHMVDKLLQEGYQVTVLDNLTTGRLENLVHHQDNCNLTIIQKDIRSLEAIKEHFQDIDHVFHFAALADIVPSIQNPEQYYTANVNGTFNVLQAAKKAGIKKLVYAASSSCYGIPDQYPTDEKAEIRPQYPYALTKNMGEQLVLHWGKIYQLPVIALRLFNVYGTRSRTSGTYGAVFGVFLAQKLAKKPFTVVGDGTQTRDFTYVTDVVEAFYCAAQSDINNEVFNVGSGGTYSVNRLVELLSGDAIYIPKRPGEPDCTFADTTKIREQLYWQPKVTLEKGVQEILANIDYWRKAPVWTPSTISEATEDWFKYLGKKNKESELKDRQNTVEEEIWKNCRESYQCEEILLSPYLSYAVRNDFKKVGINLSRYKFAGKILEGKNKILEIGCQDGFMTGLLAQFVGNIVGLDFDEEAIQIAKERFANDKMTFILGNFLKEEKIAVFDGIVSLDVIEHIAQENEELFMKNICQNLSSQGIAIIGTPNISAQEYQSEASRLGHINLYSYDRLKSLFNNYFQNVLLFGANDEIFHTGFYPMAHYLMVVGINPKR